MRAEVTIHIVICSREERAAMMAHRAWPSHLAKSVFFAFDELSLDLMCEPPNHFTSNRSFCIIPVGELGLFLVHRIVGKFYQLFPDRRCVSMRHCASWQLAAHIIRNKVQIEAGPSICREQTHIKRREVKQKKLALAGRLIREKALAQTPSLIQPDLDFSDHPPISGLCHDCSHCARSKSLNLWPWLVCFHPDLGGLDDESVAIPPDAIIPDFCPLK